MRTGVAHIPFTPDETAVIRQLATWMTVVAVVHLLLGVLFITCAGFSGVAIPGTFGDSVFGGLLLGVQAALFAGSSLLAVVEAGILFRARMDLMGIVTSDTQDQRLVSSAIKWLKIFFMAELALFVVNVGIGLIGMVFSWVVPEAGGSPGQDFVEAMRGMREGR